MYQQIECLNAPVINISRLGKEMAEFGSGFLEKKNHFFSFWNQKWLRFKYIAIPRHRDQVCQQCASYFRMSFIMTVFIVKIRILSHPHSFKWILFTELVSSKMRPIGMCCLFLLASRGLFFTKTAIISSFYV